MRRAALLFAITGFSLLLFRQPVQAATEPGDAARGEAVLKHRCTGCHALDADREGPRLRGVYGRKSASVAGFAYSAALRKSGVVWDDVALDKWLADTDAAIPGNDMGFRLPKEQDRADLIAYLKTAK